MKMKWNWGTKLLMAMILFILLMTTMVFLSMQQTFDLVEKDYYPKGLEYQKKIEKTQNARQAGEKVTIEHLGEEVIFTFQSFFDPGEIKGSIVFYRPSDERMDMSFDIRPDTARRQVCNVAGMPKGKYTVKLDYQAGGKGYYQEETVLVKMH